ncbi:MULTISPECIES: site-specific integrase [unclassified Acidocella]|uniref:site-specific integrase n=1 Tax=unclassified Acidocella TaxID=2648610 RepID=UPI00028E8C68|nr:MULTISPECIES: site-specific integrase [unclassified Acidocella]EKM99421.1 integrase family protein [Acidocella sp. MX-AZ02]WBO58060.1 tyrosine-type recombinase/integrase [Acidocella sp. MX-AZ03]
MAAITITRTTMQKLPPLAEGAVKQRIFDDRLVGFIAEQRRGTVTFYFRYKDARGRQHEIRLGRLGDVTVDQARRRAEQLKAEVSLGGDPVAEKAKLKSVPTVEEFARDRYLPHVQEPQRSAHNVEAYLRLRILPAIGKKALDEVTQADVAEMRRRFQAEGLANGTVNRHLATLRAMFNQALKWELYEGKTPASSPGMLREQHRDKYLSPAETQALFRALAGDKDETAASVLALLAVTGARRGEALQAKWENVDLERCILTVPRSKSGRTRHIPLSPVAVAILQRQLAKRSIHPENPYVFPSARLPGKPVEGVRGAWVRAKKAAGLPDDLRIHDLRHSFASALANAGTPLNEIGTVLGHSQLSTTTRYAHHSPQRLIDTATTALRAWNLLPEAQQAEGAEVDVVQEGARDAA